MRRDDSKGFWRALQTGIEVAVAGPGPNRLLGIRDGFAAYFGHHLDGNAPVIVVPQEVEDGRAGLTVTDETTLALARDRARTLAKTLGDAYPFYAASEGGLQSLEMEGQLHSFVRSWTVIVSPLGEAYGGSGSVQLPPDILGGRRGEEIPLAVPGTRRRGGLVKALTGGLETRRTVIAEATRNALATLFFEVFDGSPERNF